MANEHLLVHIDTIVSDGVPMAFEDGSATISGAHRFENTVVPSAQGDDFARRSRVPTTMRFRYQFNNQADPVRMSAAKDIQMTFRDSQSGRRGTCRKCMFGTMGDIGGGPVDMTYLLLSPIEWL